MFSNSSSAFSIPAAHEPGSVQFGASSRYSGGLIYTDHLIGMALGSGERTNEQYFRPDNSTSQVISIDHMNGRSAGGRAAEIVTIPGIGGVPSPGSGVPDGGITVMLLGTALGALGIARRYIRT